MILRYLILNKFYLNNRFKNSIYYCKGIEPYRFIFLFNIFFKYPDTKLFWVPFRGRRVIIVYESSKEDPDGI